MKFIEDINELKKVVESYGRTVAHRQVSEGWTTENFEILKLKDTDGRTVAHAQVWNGWTTNNFKILELTNYIGWSVAHEQVYRGWTTEDPQILKLKDEKGKTVLLTIFENSDWIPPENLKNIKIDGKTIWEHYIDKQLEEL